MKEELGELIARLRKRAEQDRQYAENNATVADLLQPQMDRFDARNDASGEPLSWNTYAVRMQIDHRNSAKRDSQWADDLNAAADALATLLPTNQRDPA